MWKALIDDHVINRNMKKYKIEINQLTDSHVFNEPGGEKVSLV